MKKPFALQRVFTYRVSSRGTGKKKQHITIIDTIYWRGQSFAESSDVMSIATTIDLDEYLKYTPINNILS